MPLLIDVDNEEDLKDFEAAKALAGKLGPILNGEPAWTVMLTLAMLVAYGIGYMRKDNAVASNRECLNDHMEAVAAFLGGVEDEKPEVH